jgi:hypothetical protein
MQVRAAASPRRATEVSVARATGQLPQTGPAHPDGETAAVDDTAAVIALIDHSHASPRPHDPVGFRRELGPVKIVKLFDHQLIGEGGRWRPDDVPAGTSASSPRTTNSGQNTTAASGS